MDRGRDERVCYRFIGSWEVDVYEKGDLRFVSYGV